jgi:polygalacturonase
MRSQIVKKHILLVFIVLPSFVFGQQKLFNIIRMGANPDGKTDNTMIIQKAIDEASKSGNGKVIFPAGRFVTGVIHLKSNVEIHLAENAYWLGSPKRSDYGPKDASGLIVANNQHHISITGKGVIDGQGDQLIKDMYRMLTLGTLEDTEWQVCNIYGQTRPEERNRPRIIALNDCDSLLIKGITIRNGLCWVQDYRNCTNLIMDSIQVESTTCVNNDGIDLVDCKNVRVTNCRINADDDGICFKSHDRNSRCENIYVANCTVRSSASAIKFGTASWGGFKNITVRDITVYDTFRSAIAIESVDGGILEDVNVSNIKAMNTGNAIFIRLGHRNKDSVISQLRNVHISNISVEIPATKPDKGYPEEGPEFNYPHNVYPSSITGIPGHPVENVTIENVEIFFPGGGDTEVANMPIDYLSNVPERIASYPEFSMFGELPAWAFFIRHVDGLKMKNISIKSKSNDYRPAFVVDNATKLNFSGVKIEEKGETGKQIFLKNTTNSVMNLSQNVLNLMENCKDVK